jgi:hypothetical protein
MGEFSAGAKRRMVTYLSEDDGSPVNLDAFAARVSAAAETEAARGWQIVSFNVFPIRQTGTAGNVFFQSGGQYATQLAAVVVYGAE